MVHYMYLIPLVTLQIWMNEVKYNQVLNQTLVPPGVNSQATLQYTKSFKLAAPPHMVQCSNVLLIYTVFQVSSFGPH